MGASSSRSTTRAIGLSSGICSSARPSTGRSSAGSRSATGSPTSRQLPLTEKDELRATRTPENPIGAHLCATPAEIVRIYSTSGTTGAPELRPADRGRPRELGDGLGAELRGVRDRSRPAHRLHVQRRAVRGRCGARELRAHRADPHPRRHREHAAATRGDRAPEARGSRAHAVVRGVPRRELRPPRRRASSESWSRASPAAESRPSARSSRRAGERASPRRWGSATSASRSGASARSRTGCTSARAASSTPELIDPETGAAVSMEDGAGGELVLTHLRHRAAPLLRFRTRDHVEVRTSQCPCGRTGPRIRCIGRTDDMLIVRGVNVFPSAIREVVSEFAPAVSGHVLVKPRAAGVKQEPPLPVSVELGRDGATTDDARGRDPRPVARGSHRPDAGRARAVREPAAERVQVDARRTWVTRGG